MDVRSTFFQNIACILMGVMFLNPIVSAAAEVTVDAAAGGNTQLGSANNGVPVINIATPNGNGLSHNKFTDYNVGQQGLILNNSTNSLQSTQLGGYILGNSNLNGRAASVILNEVNGGSPSQLKGYTEVAGQSAHVIVANPNGITCNGCGFINTPRATLTTGKPVVENGQLQRYDVDGGQIAIEGVGLNAGNVGQFELITRAAAINAEIQAQQLAIVAGRNEVDAQTLTATAKADDGSAKPSVAIDSSALGGMYAGAIRLVGTEAGVGVKLAGDMAASGGDIQIDANGQLSLARTAAAGNIAIKAQDVALTESAYASGNATVTATGAAGQVQLVQGKSLAAGGDLKVEAARIDNQGSLEAGVRSDGSGNASATLALEGGELVNRGQIQSQGALSADLSRLDNRDGQIVAVGSATVAAQTIDNQRGTLLAQQDMTVQGHDLDNRAGTLASNKALSIEASGTLRNGDDGLILSKEQGLTVEAGVLDNQNGTLQANSGDLKATATTTLDNSNGKILAGNGKVTLEAKDLLNHAGVLQTDNGAIETSSETFDNSQGRTQANSLLITTRQRLDNSNGHLVATHGDVRVESDVAGRSEVINDGGRIVATQNVSIDAASLSNKGGSVGAEQIELNLDSHLDNDSGLIEAGETLSLTADSASNAGGKLRALGSTGESVFGLGGLFSNDSGLVEIGNARFSLTSGSLSNQQGTLRHVGDQGFRVSLARAGQAGGNFITNGVFALDVGSWVNTSVLQAQRIDLKVGAFTQTATGKLLSVEDIVATGDTWVNDGSIETDGELSLILTGKYSGSGALKSQGDMTLRAASAELLQGAQLRAGGQGDIQVSGDLTNIGQLSAAGDLRLKSASLANLGTLGAAQALRVEAPGIVNWGGLIFSGAEMELRGDSLTNLNGDIFSLDSLSIAKDDTLAQMSLLENRSGSIESGSDMTLRAASLINRKEAFTLGRTQTSGHISVVCYDCGGDHHNVDYVATESFETQVSEDSAASRIHSGGNLNIRGGAIANRYSSLSATGNIDIVGASLENTGAASGIIERVRRFNTGRITDGTDERFRDAHIYPYNAQPLPKEMPSALYRWNLTSDIETLTPTGVGAAAVIQAGGNVSINATQSITNASVLMYQAPQAGNAQTLDTDVGLTSQPLVVRLNAQLPPDTQQQAVNPLALPGFSLPQGQNGLFRVSTDPSHPYLIETNPLFASLKGFLNSDYLLSRIGFSSEQTQRRLGDGLYEQRLIEQAVVARTGKRFLDGLTSNEAQFRYLMDNAIASKEALNLAPGVALTAEQVAALTHDIVWMQEQEVNGQKVLVPVLYLAQANDRLAPSGALIQGHDVALFSGGNLNNSGTLRASHNLSLTASNIGNSGLMQASERVSLLATGSIRNTQGGLINGKDVSAIALTGDIINERSITQEARSGRGFSQLTSVVDKSAGIEASNNLTLSAGRDIQNIGGSLKAGGDATLSAERDLVIASAAAENGSMRKDKRHFWEKTSTAQYGSDVQVGGDLDVKASNDITVVASTIKAGGDIDFEAGNDVTIASAANGSSSEYRYKGNGKKINKEDSTVRQQASIIEARGDLDITADNNLIVSASQLKAGDEAYLYAGDQLALLSAENSDYSLYDKKKKGSWGSKEAKRDEVTDVRNLGSTITTGGDLTLESGGDQLYRKAGLDSGGDLTLDSGGAITFEAVKDMHQESHDESSSSWVWTSMDSKGKVDETLRQSQLTAKGEILISAVDGLHIDVKQVNQQTVSQSIDAMVQADPSMAWLKEVEARGDVDWRQVKEVHDKWSDSHSGLGGPAMIIIAIIVTYFTAGAASGLVGSAAGATAGSGTAFAAGTAATAATTTTAATAATAAGWANVAATAVLTSAASTATISTINNKGDVGAALKETFNSDNLKNYVVAGTTAGLTAGLYNEWTGTQTGGSTALTDSTSGALANGGKVAVSNPSGLSSWQGVGQFAANQALQNTTSAVLNKALGRDGSLGDALQTSLANTFAAFGFNLVGDIGQANNLQEGGLTKIGLHAVMGGLAAEAAGGDFKTGALAAGVNEALIDHLATQYADMPKDKRDALLAMNSQLIGVLSTAIQDPDADAEKLQTGSWVAQNSTQYNRQLHPDEIEFASDDERVKRFAAENELTPDQARQELLRTAAAMVDRGWDTALTEGDGKTTRAAGYLRNELAQAKNDHLFQVSLADYNNERVGLVELFKDRNALDKVLKNVALVDPLDYRTDARYMREVLNAKGEGSQEGFGAAFEGAVSGASKTALWAMGAANCPSCAASDIEDAWNSVLSIPEELRLKGYLDNLHIMQGGGAAVIKANEAASTAAGVGIGLAIGGGLGGTRSLAQTAPTIDRATMEIVWGKGIQSQGMPWENYLASQLPAGSRLPPGFKTFDFFDESTGVAISAKTLDTTTPSKIANPGQIYSSLKRNIDAIVKFSESSKKGVTVSSSQIAIRELQVAIPKATTNAQLDQINKAIKYGLDNGIAVRITKAE